MEQNAYKASLSMGYANFTNGILELSIKVVFFFGKKIQFILKFPILNQTDIKEKGKLIY